MSIYQSIFIKYKQLAMVLFQAYKYRYENYLSKLYLLNATNYNKNNKNKLGQSCAKLRSSYASQADLVSSLSLTFVAFYDNWL